MPREYRLYIRDILEAVRKIEKYTGGLSFEQFRDDRLRLDAVMHNLMVIGEAVKNIPDEVRERHTNVDWRRIAGLRDLIVHAYFALDLKIIWSIVREKVPELREQIEAVLKDLADD